MTLAVTAFLRGRTSGFARAREGSVAVEFALISTVLIALFAAAVDFSYMIGARRDAERSSTLIARAMSSCPYADSPVVATWKGTDCVTQTLQMVIDRQANVVVTIPNFTLQSAAVQRINGAIAMCPGVSNYMPSSVSTNILSVLTQDDDVGVFAVVGVVYTPFLPKVLSNYGIGSSPTYSKPTIDLWGNGSSYACAAKQPS